MRRQSNVLPVLAIVLLVPPMYLTARWIRIFNDVSGHEDRVAEFVSILPRALRDPVASTLFALVCAVAAVAIGTGGLSRLTGLRRWLCGAVVTIGGLLSLLLAWSLL